MRRCIEAMSQELERKNSKIFEALVKDMESKVSNLSDAIKKDKARELKIIFTKETSS